MIAAQHPQWPRQVAYLAAFCAFLALSACGGGDSSANTSAATSTNGTSAGTSTTGTSAGNGATGSASTADSAIARKWNVNAGEWFGARLPGVPLSCDGPLLLDLNAAGSFTWGGSYTCYNVTSGRAESNGRFNSSGTYTTTGDRLSMTVTTDSAETQLIGGPWVSAPSTLSSQTGTYSVSGQRLTLTFPTGSGSTTWSVILTGS
jgi:hypothetical protein